MNGSVCPRGHGTWLPERERCPVCAGPVEPRTLPAEGVILAGTAAGGAHVAVVQLGDVVVPALLNNPLRDDERVVVRAREDGLLVATRAGAP